MPQGTLVVYIKFLKPRRHMLYVFTFGRGRYPCPKGAIIISRFIYIHQDLHIYIKTYLSTSRFTYIYIKIYLYAPRCIYIHQNLSIYIYIYQHLVKSNQWSIINAAFRLVELLLGYMLQSTSSEKHRLFGGKKGLKSSFNKLKFFYSRYF